MRCGWYWRRELGCCGKSFESALKYKSSHTGWCGRLFGGGERTDSLFCGKARLVETVHRTVSKSRLSNPPSNTKVPTPNGVGTFVVGEDGFEPSKRNAADLQSVPFGHSGTPPYAIGSIASLYPVFGAGRRTRTPDLLITNQLLYQLSYTGVSNRTRIL